MGIMTEIFLSLGIVIFLFWWLRQLNKNKTFFKKIPGPPTIPILGNALDFRSTTDILETFSKYVQEYGNIVKVQIGPLRKLIVISDYKFLEFILSSTKLLNKSDDYHHLRPWLGTGLLTADAPKWKKHRRILTPAFHFQILEQFIESFETNGEKLIEKLQKEVDNSSVDIYPFITLCALDIICECIMGTNINAQMNDNSDYVRSVKNMCRIVVERSLSPIAMYDLLFPLTPNYYAQKKALEILHNKTCSVIKQRQNELGDKTIHKPANEKNKKIFLDLLLEAQVDGRSLTQEEIMNEVDTFMFEGHDTTSSAISFTLFCLANYPEVQARAFEEQKALFGNNQNPKVTYADLQSMKYLEQVIKESLRVYPPVPFYVREISEEIEYNEEILPRGETLLLFAYGIHRDPKYFKNPEKFDPDRFENIDGTFPYSYIPFSAGSRNCIGQKFAMLEIKSTVSRVIRKFDLKPAVPKHTLKLAAETILKSTTGIKICLKLKEQHY